MRRPLRIKPGIGQRACGIADRWGSPDSLGRCVRQGPAPVPSGQKSSRCGSSVRQFRAPRLRASGAALQWRRLALRPACRARIPDGRPSGRRSRGQTGRCCSRHRSRRPSRPSTMLKNRSKLTAALGLAETVARARAQPQIFGHAFQIELHLGHRQARQRAWHVEVAHQGSERIGAVVKGRSRRHRGRGQGGWRRCRSGRNPRGSAGSSRDGRPGTDRPAWPDPRWVRPARSGCCLTGGQV